MNIEHIRQLARTRRYQIKLHAVQHALQEGFSEKEIIDAILDGSIIEPYPDRNRVLICGRVTLAGIASYLHVVCEQNYSDQIEIVTAYIPSTREWTTPPLKRKKQKR